MAPIGRGTRACQRACVVLVLLVPAARLPYPTWQCLLHNGVPLTSTFLDLLEAIH